MKKQKQAYGLQEKGDIFSLHDAEELKRYATGDSDVDAFVHYLADGIVQAISNRSRSEPARDYGKIDDFLHRHSGTSFKNFLNEVMPGQQDNIDRKTRDNDRFGEISKVYLSAFSSYEDEGYDIDKIINRMREEYIPGLKKKGTDPTFEAVRRLIQGNGKDLIINLERRPGEVQEDYFQRLFAIRSTQIELLFRYEHERKLDRFRETDRASKDLLERGSDQDRENFKRLLQSLDIEVRTYGKKYPEMSSRQRVQEKLKDLESIT